LNFTKKLKNTDSRCENGREQTIETTDGHPFWVVTDNPDLSRAARSVVDENGFILYHENIEPGLNGYWVEAKDLRVGDVFLGANGELSTLTDILRVEQSDGITVFNFSVEGNHNYYILAKEFEYGQSCILVHNAGPTCYDPRTGEPVGRFIVDTRGNVMIEPVGGSTIPYPPTNPNAIDTHTLWPNGSNYQRLNPQGHAPNPTPHGHAHLMGTGPGKKGQGPSLGPGATQTVVKPNSVDAHWPIH